MDTIMNLLKNPVVFIPAIILGGILVIVFIVQSFRHRRLGCFTAIVIEAAAILLHFMLKDQIDGTVFSLPNLITILLCGLFVAYMINSKIRDTEKNNVLVVGATGRNTRLTKSYYDSVFSGHILSFSRGVLYAYEILIFFVIGMLYGFCKAVLVQEFANGTTIFGKTGIKVPPLTEIPYYVLCGLGILIAFVRMVKPAPKKKAAPVQK